MTTQGKEKSKKISQLAILNVVTGEELIPVAAVDDKKNYSVPIRTVFDSFNIPRKFVKDVTLSDDSLRLLVTFQDQSPLEYAISAGRVNGSISVNGIDVPVTGLKDSAFMSYQEIIEDLVTKSYLQSEKAALTDEIDDLFLLVDRYIDWTELLSDRVTALGENGSLSSLWELTDNEQAVTPVGNKGIVTSSYISAQGSNALSDIVGTGGMDREALWFELADEDTDKASREQIASTHLADFTAGLNLSQYATESALTDYAKKKDLEDKADLDDILFELTNNGTAVKPKSNDGTPRDIVSEGALSAMTANPLSDIVGTGGMDREALWFELADEDTDKASREQIASTHLTDALASYATQAYVTAEINALIGSAPGALDTLNELAAALGNDPNFATTVLTQLGNKADASSLELYRPMSNGDFTNIDMVQVVNLVASGSLSAHTADAYADVIGVGGGFDEAMMWEALDATDEVIGIAHIPDLTTSKITDLESWISGKGYASASALDSKVDKIAGKGLSTNDFTAQDKTKLDGIDLSKYLPLSGGKMSGGIYFEEDYGHILCRNDMVNGYSNVIWSSASDNAVIFGSPHWSQVILEVSSAGTATLQRDGVQYELIHTGNIGSYALTRNNTFWGEYPDANGNVSGTITAEALATTVILDNNVSKGGFYMSLGYTNGETFRIDTYGTWNKLLVGLNNGNVGIGTVLPQAKLDVNGDIISRGSISAQTANALADVVGGVM